MEKEINLPKSHSEISITTFEKIIDIQTKQYESEINRCIDLASLMTGLSTDDIESMDFEDLKELLREINSINSLSYGDNLSTKIIVDGVEYARRETKSFTVKETIMFQNIFGQKKEGYLNEIAAVLFHPVVDGEIKFDYSEKAIKERKEKFNSLTMDVISPLLTKLTDFLISKNAK